MKYKHYLVHYTIVSGEFEFSGETVLTLNSRQKLSTQVHKYFLDFYGEGEGECEEKGSYYLYVGGQIAVKKINAREITEAQRQVLKDLNIA